MLVGVRLVNYKSFEEAYLELRPLIVLLGANSSGKSSVINFFRLMQQTCLEMGSGFGSIVTEGDFINYGDPIDIVHKKAAGTHLEVHFDINDDNLSSMYSLLRDNYTEALMKILDTELDFRRMIMARSRQKDRRSEPVIGLLNHFDYLSEIIEVKKESVFAVRRFGLSTSIRRRMNSATINKLIKWLLELDEFKSLLDAALLQDEDFALVDAGHPGLANRPALPKPSYSSKYFSAIKEAIARETRSCHATLELRFCVNNSNKFELTSLRVVSTPSETILSIDFCGMAITSATFLSIKLDDLTILNNYLQPQRTFPNIYTRGRLPHRINPEYGVLRLIDIAMSNVVGYFGSDRLQFIGPLRAHPRKVYTRETNIELSSREVQLIRDLRENTGIVEFVDNQMAPTQMRVVVIPLGSSSEQIVLVPSHIVAQHSNYSDLVAAIQQDSIRLRFDLTDVGFGMSQLMPIVVGIRLMRKDGVLLVEQPEVHLHPRLQAQLADVFCAAVCPVNEDATSEAGGGREVSSRSAIIETHSEYFVTRLRRLIAEGRISPDVVACYFFQPIEHGIKNVITLKLIGEKGEFKWPEWFFADENRDLAAIAVSQADSSNRNGA